MRTCLIIVIAIMALPASVYCEACRPSLPIGPSRPQLFEVPAFNDRFTGRGKELEKLDEMFSKEGTANICHSQHVYGGGGIGKTQLALAYVRRAYEGRSQVRFSRVVWINCKKNIEAQLRRVGIACGLEERSLEGKRAEDLSVAVYRALVQHRHVRCVLVVFDDVDEAADIAAYRPAAQEHDDYMKVLVTSRNTELGGEMGVVELEEFSEAEALAYIARCVAVLKDEEGREYAYQNNHANTFVRMLRLYPLALAQAMAYVLKLRLEFKKYMELYRSTVDLQRWLLSRTVTTDASVYVFTTMTTWQVTFDRLQDMGEHFAIGYLVACSFLSADAIARDLLEDVLHTNTFAVVQAVGVLRRFSLVQFNEPVSSGTIRVHRMLQDVVRLNETLLQVGWVAVFGTPEEDVFTRWWQVVNATVMKRVKDAGERGEASQQLQAHVAALNEIAEVREMQQGGKL